MDKEEVKKIVFDVRGCAFEIWRTYRYGLSEHVYEAALELLLTDKGYKVDRQVYLQCYYKGRKIKQDYRMDLVINDDFIIENKTVQNIIPEHRAQLFNYCHLFNKSDAMLLNFGPNGVRSEWYYMDLETRKATYINE